MAPWQDRAKTNDMSRQDAQINGEATGAMSWAFISALKKNPQQSYVQLLNSIRDELSAKYTQKPQLSCSHPLSKLHIFLTVRPRTDAMAFRYESALCDVGGTGFGLGTNASFRRTQGGEHLAFWLACHWRIACFVGLKAAK